LLNNSLTLKSGLEVLVRGRGLLVGVELRTAKGLPAGSIAIRIIKNLLHRGFIFLPEGEHGNVIGFTPPLTIAAAQIRAAVRALNEELVRVPSQR
jgi:4-aminobutyrate aminotransferase-like enzyme